MEILSILPKSFYQVEVGDFNNYVDVILFPLQTASIFLIIGFIFTIPYIVVHYIKYKRNKRFYSSFWEYIKYIHRNSLQAYTACVAAFYAIALICILYSFGVYIYGILYL